ncbi:flagellar hook-length control protein FliK [Lachnospira multipara]|uniref:flagellar hook-length control protein FliK n=1 Tax=Lachnospira multipara TaxID=28051 RepID=UPI0004E19D87|nr:flagellar hook-length control protein FliK [Lachnospira multipara]
MVIAKSNLAVNSFIKAPDFSSKKSDDVSLSFGQIFNSSVKNNKPEATKYTSPDSNKISDNNNLKKLDEQGKIARDDSRGNVSDNKTREEVTNIKENDTEIKEVSKDIVNEKGKEIISEIAKKLDLSEDEVIETMALLNMNVLDLFNLDNITELMVELNGQGEVALIVDGSFTDALADVNETVKEAIGEIADTLNISPEEFKENISNTKVDFKDIFLKEDIKINVDKKDISVEKNVEKVLVEVPKTNLDDVKKEDEEPSLKDVIASKIVVSKKENDTANTKEDSSDKPLLQDEKAGSKQEKLVHPENLVVNDIAKNFETAIEESFDPKVNQIDIVRQVVDQIKVINTEGLKEIEVMLNPENLGSVHITVTQKEGIITAHLTAQTEAVKKALENQMIALKENFNNQGIKIEAVEVTIQSHGFENNLNAGNNNKDNQDNKNKNKRLNLDLDSLNDLDLDDLNMDELRAIDLIENGNSSVSYMA